MTTYPLNVSRLMQSFLVKHQIIQVTQLPYSPDLAPCDFWLFPKLKSPLKERDFRPSMRFKKIWQGSWWWLGELCEVPRYLLWRGLRHHYSVYNVSFSFFKRFYLFYFLQRGREKERERTMWGSKVPTLKGTETSLSSVQCFLCLVSSVNVSIFHITELDTFCTDLA